LRGDGADSSKHGGINGAGIEKEGAEDFLDTFGVFGIEGRRGISQRGILCFGTILRLDPGMRRKLRPTWCCMFKALEGSFDVARDGNIAGAVNIVESKGETAILFGVPIDAGLVEQRQGIKEVLRVGPVGVFDAEVVDD
jgi:hypothetical protein